MRYVLNFSDVEKLFGLVMILLGFYVAFAVQNVFDMTFYGRGKTTYMLAESVIFTFAIWKVISEMVKRSFYLPWEGVVISIAATLLVMAFSVLYAVRRVRMDHPVEVLRDENA